MNLISISRFKAHAYRVINTVATTRESVVITKRGKALAELIPFHPPQNKPVPGKLSSTFISGKDIVSPIGEKMWKACT